MTSFKSLRITHDYIQTNPATPEKLFPLLCPVREQDWLPGWQYRLIYSDSGVAELGCVFTTPNPPPASASHGQSVREITWIVTDYDPANFRIAYVWINPGQIIAALQIQLRPHEHAATRTQIRYRYTGLSPEGNRELQGYNQKWFEARMRNWETTINHYLRSSSSWLPGYNQANSHYQNGSTYDANGNLLADTFHTYTWNQDNRPSGITDLGITLTYDAMGRLVEKNTGSAHTQLLYSPIGRVATMNGQTTTDFLVPMPGGGKYEQGDYFWHPDWLGSTRLVSSRTSRSMRTDLAYAPYGELYNLFGASDGISFTGDLQDIVAGTFDTLNRELNPIQGRWLTPDPARLSAVDPTNPQTWNRYAYVGNDPLSATDPLGLFVDVVGTGRWGYLDGLRDPGGAWFYAIMQAWSMFNSPMWQAETQYFGSIRQNWKFEFLGSATASTSDGYYYKGVAYGWSFTPAISFDATALLPPSVTPVSYTVTTIAANNGQPQNQKQTIQPQKPTVKQQLCRAAAWSGGLLTAIGFGARAAGGGAAIYSIITGSEVVLLEGTPIGVPLAVIGGSIWATQRLVCD